MNWDAIGAISVLVGSIAVLVTLAYLAVQTKSNSKAVRSNSNNPNDLLSDQLWLAQWRAMRTILTSRGGGESWARQQDLLTTQFRDGVRADLD